MEILMAAKKTPSTVKTLRAAPKVATKTAKKSVGGTTKTAAKKAASKPAERAEGAKRTATQKLPSKPEASSEKTALDVLRLFVKTYANL